MQNLLKRFEEKQPEIVFEWKDPETEAEGWIVINSLRGGSAGGGTRMRKGLNKHEVLSLAKTMEVKFTISGPPIGGAKSGINFDPNDPRKKGVLERWYKAVMPLLKTYYGTGGDLNVDEIHEVIPITEQYGLLHPQEGTAVGHFKPDEAGKKRMINNLREGVSKVITHEQLSPSVERKYVVADMITGYGVAEAVRNYYEFWNGNIVNKRVIIQGWGNVASAAAYYLAGFGAKIVGIIDRSGGLMNSNGLSFEEVRQLFLDKDGNKLVADKLMSFEEVNEKIWSMGAEIMVPAAASRLLTQEQLQQMIDNELEVISCGANVPFADEQIFMGPIATFADNNVSVIPDFIANCGMARVFAYLMSEEAQLEDTAIFKDTSNIIRKTLMRIQQFHPRKTGISAKALEMSLTTLLR